MEFQVGDTVRLKSGSPTMTVEQAEITDTLGNKVVACIWFERIGAKQEVKRASFPAATLESFRLAKVSSELI